MQRVVKIEHAYKPRPIKKKTDAENFFIVKNKGDLSALKYWLAERKFNTFVESQDKFNQKLFGLIWDFELGKFPSTRRSKRGAIVVKKKELIKPVAFHILNTMSTENTFGEQWRAQQFQLWRYGRDD